MDCALPFSGFELTGAAAIVVAHPALSQQSRQHRRRTLDTMNQLKRTVGLHPCVGKTAAGVARPTTIVIRGADGKLAEYEVDDQQLLDFLSCGAVTDWRDATPEDDFTKLPRHHVRRHPSTRKAYDEYEAADQDAIDAERSKLFSIKPSKKGPDFDAYFRMQVPAETIVIDSVTDTIGVANGGLGSQIISIVLGRYPEMNVRRIGSGTLKELRPKFDELLPKALRRKAEKMRSASEGVPDSDPSPGEDGDGTDAQIEQVSKSKAKDANARYDAHRIAVALADNAMSKFFQACTQRDRDWAAVSIAYRELEDARKARVAAEQQFRQIRLAAMRSLVSDARVPYISLGDEEGQEIEDLLAGYMATLKLCKFSDKEITRRCDTINQAYARITGARSVEETMEEYLEAALNKLPEYTDFLAHIKSQGDYGKFIGNRIFGRWIAGFGTPMASRMGEPLRESDIARIEACRLTLTTNIAKLTKTGLPPQPPQGGGRTREWLLACERIVAERLKEAQAQNDSGTMYHLRLLLIESQTSEIAACRAAYRSLDNAKKSAKDRPLNRVIAFMGLHVRNGGKYEGTPKERQFPRRAKGMRANWDERLLRQGAYQWGTLIIKGGSHWKTHVYEPTKARAIAEGWTKSRAHRKGFWRMVTVAMRWVINEWFAWESRKAQTTAAKAA